MARNSGETRLAELKKGADDKLAWTPVKSASRGKRSEFPPGTLQALFKADVQKLPSYVGAWVADSYMLFKIVKVSQPDKIDVAVRQGLRGEFTSLVAQEELSAYLAGLRARYEISINKAALEPRERQ